MSHLIFVLWLLLGISYVAGYEVHFSDTDYSRQICTGMWGTSTTFINVTFEHATSQGQVAMVIYEWSDMRFLGKVTSVTDDNLPKTYVCTSDAVRGGFCTPSQLGTFIIDPPEGVSVADTSFWSAPVLLNASTSTESDSSSFWDDPNGNPSIPDDDHTSPWRSRGRSISFGALSPRQSTMNLNPSPNGTLSYHDPIQYFVRKTGYYCVAIVPVTTLSYKARQASTDVPFHPTYQGVVLFQNSFNGMLPATEYPKINFYFSMSLVYIAAGAAWGWLCYKHYDELLPMQYYISSLVGFLIIEMITNWVYYRYLNAHGKTTASTVFLIVVSILTAGRNALSFFMLLVVSMGLSVVCESLGRAMLRCKVLAAGHFVFGVLYAVGIVELELQSTSAWVLLLFIFPLAATLTTFLIWILYSLNTTIKELAARKQRYKLTMFRRLNLILILANIVIMIFFIVSTVSFSGRLAEDFGANSWRTQWWLLDGYLAILYFVTFWTIAYLWRPSANNRR